MGYWRKVNVRGKKLPPYNIRLLFIEERIGGFSNPFIGVLNENNKIESDSFYMFKKLTSKLYWMELPEEPKESEEK